MTEARLLVPRRAGLLDSLRFMRDPRAALHGAVRAYGDPFVIRFGGGPVLLTGDPECIRTIFTADPDVFGIPMRSMIEPFFGPSSMMMASGERHRQQRKLLAPPFHGARMRAYGRVVVESVHAAAARWVKGAAFVMADTTRAITMEVILRAVFGVEAGPRRREFGEATIALMAAMASSAITYLEFTRRRFGGLGPWARFERARDRFHALVAAELADRRAAGDAGDREDILSLMLRARYDDGAAMTDLELRDQLHMLMFGGQDTTTTGLAWAFYWLHRHLEVRERVLAELAGLGPDPEPDAVAALPYLDAVCQETLRIHPLALVVARLLQRPLELAGHAVPAGTTLLPSLLLLHDREDLYPEPRRFDPERFVRRRFTAFEFMPFGGGARRCIGAALAMTEMKLVLATVLTNYRLSLASEAPVEVLFRGMVPGPRGGVRMIYEGPR